MENYQRLISEIEIIKSRNKTVEKNKAWETSYTRRFFIALFTYIAISLYMYSIGVEKPWLNAIIPTVGFLLSTTTLPFIRAIWEKYIYKKV